MNILEAIEIWRHNRNLYKSGLADKKEIRLTAVGYNPETPCEEHWIKDQNPPSGEREYYKVIRTDKDK